MQLFSKHGRKKLEIRRTTKAGKHASDVNIKTWCDKGQLPDCWLAEHRITLCAEMQKCHSKSTVVSNRYC